MVGHTRFRRLPTDWAAVPHACASSKDSRSTACDAAPPGLAPCVPRRSRHSPGDSRLLAKLFEAVADLVAIDAEQLRRPALVSSGAFERLRQQLPFDVLEVDALRWQSK